MLLLLVAVLLHPPLAATPGKLLAYLIRLLIQRIRLATGHFLDAFWAALGELGYDLWAWLDSWLDPGGGALGENSTVTSVSKAFSYVLIGVALTKFRLVPALAG